MPNLPAILFVPCVDTEPELGMGFNSSTGEFLGKALSFAEGEEPGGALDGQSVEAYAKTMSSTEQLMTELKTSFSAEGRYGLLTASTKVSYSNNTSFNSSSQFVLAKCVVTNSLVRGRDFSLRPNMDPWMTAARNADFKANFGDYYVRGLRAGGEFYAVYRISSNDTSLQSSLAVSLGAEINGIAASGSFKAELNKAQSKRTSETSLEISFFQSSGVGVEASTTLSPDEIFTRLRDFPAIVSRHPRKYAAEVASYGTVPLDLPQPEEVQELERCLVDADEKRQRFALRRNDAQFVRDNPRFFDNPPTASDLDAAIAVYTKALNAVMEHARKMAKGTIPPSLFDLSANGIGTLPDLAIGRAAFVNTFEIFLGTWTPQTLDCPIKQLDIEPTDGSLRIVARFDDEYFDDRIATWNPDSRTFLCGFKPKSAGGRGGTSGRRPFMLAPGQEICIQASPGARNGEMLAKVLTGTVSEITFGGAKEYRTTFRMIV